ncbi:MAG TPA: hypothetical protein VLH40_08425 [Atribacteraceae bacterium]|nr:hypothetical protein [Atribacteraceae bacterium]
MLKRSIFIVFLFSLVLFCFLLPVHAEVILDFALCKGLDQDGLPLERVDKFSSEDELVMCWIFLESVRAGDELLWKFTDPEGRAFESIFVAERDKQYVGAKGELHLAQLSNLIQPGYWRVSFYFNGLKSLELGFEVVGSDILASQDMEEKLTRTRDLLSEFGYMVLEINVTDGNQSFLRMEAFAETLSQAFWNQLGMGFEALHRLLPEFEWYMVQLVWEDRYVLSFQVRARDFEMWRVGHLSADEFWKNKVIRYVYDLIARQDIPDVRQFYMEQFGVIY